MSRRFLSVETASGVTSTHVRAERQGGAGTPPPTAPSGLASSFWTHPLAFSLRSILKHRHNPLQAQYVFLVGGFFKGVFRLSAPRPAASLSTHLPLPCSEPDPKQAPTLQSQTGKERARRRRRREAGFPGTLIKSTFQGQPETPGPRRVPQELLQPAARVACSWGRG